MQLDYLDEFITFSHYMNYTTAARIIPTTQSSLYKHIQQLEADLGFELVRTDKGKPALTEAGSVFLSKAQSILKELDELIVECQNIQAYDRQAQTIVTHSFPFRDKSSTEFAKLLQIVRASGPIVKISYIHPMFKDIRSVFERGSLSITFEYRYGDSQKIKEQYESLGFRCVEIAQEKIVVWAHVERFENDVIDLQTLSKTPIMVPSDAASSMRWVINDLFEVLKKDPWLTYSSAKGGMNYYNDYHPSSVYLLPESCKNDSFFSSRADMKFLDFTEGNVKTCVFAICNPSGEHGDLITKAFDTYEAERRDTISS